MWVIPTWSFEMERERILGVAIRCGEAVFKLQAPARHADLILMLTIFFSELGSYFPHDQSALGFYTSRRPFADKHLAAEIAKFSGQIIKPVAYNYLTSENVW